MRPYPGLQPNVLPEVVQRQVTQVADDSIWELYRAVAKLQKGQRPTAQPTNIVTNPAGDHHLLTNLTSPALLSKVVLYDDHPQYLNILGRSGGQIAYGSPTTNNSLAGQTLFLASNPSGTSAASLTLDRDLFGITGHSVTVALTQGGTAVYSATVSGGQYALTQNGPLTLASTGSTNASLGIDASSGGTNISPFYWFDLKGNTNAISALGRISYASGANTAVANMIEFWKPGAVSATSWIDVNGVFNGTVSSSSGAVGYWNRSGTLTYLQNTGDNVTIGSTSDLSLKLAVVGTIGAASGSASGGFACRNNAGTGNFSVLFTDSNDIINIGSATDGSNIFLNPHGTTRLRLRNAGANTIGCNIGDNSAPGAMLDVRSQETGRVTQINRNFAGQTSDMFQAIDSGAISTVNATPTVAGTGYTVNDVLTVSGGLLGTVKVLTIGGGGSVASLQTTPVTAGSNYATGAGQATTGGTGTGCTVNITAVTTSTQFTINKAGHLTDSKLTIADEGDLTKRLQFQLSGINTGRTVTLAPPNSASQGTIACYDLVNTWTQNQNFGQFGAEINCVFPTTAGTGAGATGTGLLIYDSSSGFYMQFIAPSLSTSRTYQFPDSDSLVVTDTGYAAFTNKDLLKNSSINIECAAADGVLFTNGGNHGQGFRFDFSTLGGTTKRVQYFPNMTFQTVALGRAATATAGELLKYDQTGLTAIVASTNIVALAQAGMYEIFYHYEVTTRTAGDGTVDFEVTYTDDRAGGPFTQKSTDTGGPGTLDLANATLQSISGSFKLYSAASNAIAFKTTQVTGAYTAATTRTALHVRATFLG